MPICGLLVLISVVLQIIIISLSSTGDLLKCSLIFPEEYDAMLNEIFVIVVVSVGHP